jgi:hypothetical protein
MPNHHYSRDQKSPSSDAEHEALVRASERQADALEHLVKVIKEFCGTYLRSRFPYGKPEDRFGRR